MCRLDEWSTYLSNMSELAAHGDGQIHGLQQ